MSSRAFYMEDLMPHIPMALDVKPKSPNSNIDSRFTYICESGLSLDEETTTQAINLLKETRRIAFTNILSFENGMPEVEKLWFSFILYAVRKLGQCSANNVEQSSYMNEFTLCQILKVTKLNIVEFLKELPQFMLKFGTILSNMYGLEWEKKLEAKELKADFDYLSLLSKYYKNVFQEFFSAPDIISDRFLEVSNATTYVSDYYRFGWFLFLTFRIHAVCCFKDIVTCTNGLISVLAILIIHVPTRFRKFTIHDSHRFDRKNDKAVNLVASLSNMYNTSEDELKEALEKVNNIIVNILKKKPHAGSECRTGNLESIDPDGLIYFEDLLEGSNLSWSINTLEKDYVDAIHNKGEFDERIFANEGDSLHGYASFSGQFIDLNCPKAWSQHRKIVDSICSQINIIKNATSLQHSPSACHANKIIVSTNKKIATLTPVSTAMTTAKWLRTVICPLPCNPLPGLSKFLTSCDKDVSSNVKRRAYIILEAIFPSNALHSANLMDNIWAEQRKMEALKLYYRVLESMCRAEALILHADNLTSLLTNERFHRCVLACSAELILGTHKAVTMLFPAVLERTGIAAFDLSKVIESFIRHEESLPRELRRHLNSLEERLLESMVWEKSSSMYNSLIVARPMLSTEINRQGLLAEPMVSLDSIEAHINISCGSLPSLPNQDVSTCMNRHYRSPKRVCSDYRSVLVERNSLTSPVSDRVQAFNNLKPKLPPLQSAFASPTHPNLEGAGGTCAETGINIFFSKILKLSAVRINGMIDRLQLSQQMRESVYYLVQQILNQRTTLFFNRHIDQIILCCFYGIAKICQLSLTFREIIQSYRKQPYCKPQVFRNVYVHWSSTNRSGRSGKEHVDIITFYNEIFIPTVKPLLVDHGPNGTNKTSIQVSEVQNNNDGQCPVSPKISPFPSLPDMSPKKVSSVHNVYVSPLRSSKMDGLISHSSKSYYACVGESTHAYQSPSKDLTAINNQLNGYITLNDSKNTLLKSEEYTVM